MQKLHPIVAALERNQEARIIGQSDVLRLIVSSSLPAAEDKKAPAAKQGLVFSIRRPGCLSSRILACLRGAHLTGGL